jgi:hypothetical protein
VSVGLAIEGLNFDAPRAYKHPSAAERLIFTGWGCTKPSTSGPSGAKNEDARQRHCGYCAYHRSLLPHSRFHDFFSSAFKMFPGFHSGLWMRISFQSTKEVFRMRLKLSEYF